MIDQNIKQKISSKIVPAISALKRYRVIIFILFIATIYGFILLRVATITNQQPTEEQINSQMSSFKVPHLDKSIIKQLHSLEDNSVDVQALFNKARDNPFQ